MNFRTILTTLILSFSVLTGFAQQINWIRGGYGLSGGWDYVTGFHRDTNGNFYVLMPMAGGGPWPASPAYGVNFFGTEVQPPISNKKYNVIGKFDSNMNLLWVEPFLCQHNVGSAYAQENIAVDQIGSIYVSYVDTTYKFNSNGKLVWRKGFSGQRIKVNKQGQLEIYQFKNAGNTLGGNPIVNRAGTVATFDSSGNYVRHFTVNDPVFQAQTIFGKNQYGYYGVRTAQNTQYFRCRQEIFVCDSLGNTLSNSLINYSNSLNNGGLVNATFDPVLKKYYVLGFFRDTNPINKRDSSAVLSPNRLSLLQIDTSLQINNVLNMGAPHNITTGGGMFYLTPYKGSLFFTVKTIFPAKFFTHLGMLNYHGTAYNKLLIGKLDPNLNPVWTMNIGNVGNGTLIQYPIPTENGIFYAGSSGNFSNNQITFTADQGHLGWNDTFLMKITDKDSTTAQLTGRVFHDLNQNGTDDNEPGVSSQTIESDHASGISYSSEDGTYQISAAAGQNTLRAGSLPQYWARSTPDSLQVNVSALATQLHGFNFGIYPVAGIKDASVSLTPLTAARLNMPVSYQLTYRNQATDVLNGMVKVIKPAELIFQNATVAPDMISGDTLFWNYSGLKPEEKRSIVLQFTLPNDPAFNNRYLFSQAAISPLAGDTIKANNVAEVYHLVTGPFDPNDITVTPSCPVSPAFVTDGKYLEYRIRFQNVGTDTAFSVVIKDSLSVHFDLASLEFTDQSHPAKVWLKDNLLTLYFENIKLPHSAINYAGSHGFFTYRVKLKPNTAVGTTIKNRAAIFFDYNDPIWTNQVITPVASYNNPFTVSAQPAACFGGATGQITVTNSCSTVPVRYSLDNLTYQPSPVFTQLSAGLYSVWISTGTGSFRIDSISILQPDTIKFTAQPTPVTCFGDSTGAITVNSNICLAAPVSYSTDSVSFQSSPVFTQLKAGTYTIFIKTGNNSYKIDSVNVQQPDTLNFAAGTTHNNCYGDSTGVITITSNICVATPLRYSTDSLNFQSTAIFPQLSAGNYTIWVKAGNLSFRLDSIQIQQPDSILAVFTINHAVTGNGEISISTSGGNGPYLYSLNGGPAQTVAYFNNLPAGSYQVGIKDQHNCTKAYTVVIHNISGIKDNLLAGLKIYPNPFSDLLTIETTAVQEQARAQLFNPLGQLVLSQELAAGKTVLDLEELAAGVYLIKVSTAKGYRTRTLIKK